MSSTASLIQAEITVCLFKAIQECPQLTGRRKRALLHKLADGNINLKTVSEVVEATGQKLVFRLDNREIA